MVDIIKQDMTDIWAVAGDVVAPDSAKVRAGWAVEAVPRQWWNWFENRQDTNIAYMLQKGIPEWDQFTEYLTNKSYVQRNNIVYKCILTGTNKDPLTNPTNWVKAFPESTAYLETIKGLSVVNDTFAYITSAGVANNTPLTAYTRGFMNAADAATARTYLSAQLSNSNLTALSGVVAATNALPYFTGSSTMGTTTLTAAARDVLAGVDYAAIRAVLQLTSAAITPVQATALDRDVAKLMKVGAFGLGNFVDLRNTIYTTGVPSDVFGTGTTFGFASGGSTPAGSLNIPGLTGTFYGTIQVNGQFDVTGLSGTSRVFITSNGRTFTQTAASASAWGLWQESFTTGNLALTTSATDTTAGRVVKTGDYGLGRSIVLTSSDNLDNVIVSGMYRLDSVPGVPAGTNFGQLQVIRGSDTIVQIAYGYQNRVWSRAGNPTNIGGSGSWNPWVEHYTTGNTAQIVADVQAGIQPQLDAKVTRAGDTMTGSLTVPTIELGTTTTTGALDFHSASGNGDFDVRMYADSPVAGTSGAGRLTVSATGGMFVNGLINTTGAITATGNIASGGQISGAGLVSSAGLTVTTGTTTLQTVNTGALGASTVNVTNNITAAGGTIEMRSGVFAVRDANAGNTGNVHLWFYNNNGTERALMYVDNTSGIHLRSNGAGDTLFMAANKNAQFYGALAASGRVSSSTDILSAGNVYTGNGVSWMATDGNVYGGIWGGYLSNYLANNFIQPGNLQQNIINQGSAGNIGTYALLQHVGGANAGPGVLVAGTELSWATAAGGFDERVNYGTWRIMGRLSTGNKPVATTLFLRVS